MSDSLKTAKEAAARAAESAEANLKAKANQFANSVTQGNTDAQRAIEAGKDARAQIANSVDPAELAPDIARR